MRDPVCGMTLMEEEARAKSTYLNCPYYFCSVICQHKFDANPRLYLSESARGS